MILAAVLAGTVAGAPVDAEAPQLLADLSGNQGRRVRVRGYFIADPLQPKAGLLCPTTALRLPADCLGVDIGRPAKDVAGAKLEVTGVFDPGCRLTHACVDFARDLKAETVRVLP